jgi:hypothetical protein
MYIQSLVVEQFAYDDYRQTIALATWTKSVVDVYDTDRNIKRVGIGQAQFLAGSFAGRIRAIAVVGICDLAILTNGYGSVNFARTIVHKSIRASVSGMFQQVQCAQHVVHDRCCGITQAVG